MRVYTVKTLSLELAKTFDRFWPRIVIEGEVAQINLPRSGHCYFQLREGDAVLGGILWKSDWERSVYRPNIGDRVQCRGKVGLFGGKVQIYANTIAPAGDGFMAKQIQERIERLRRDGLLDPQRKRKLPRFPRVVGVATSADGAAIADFLRVSGERFPATRILISPCSVQGPQAPASVVRALDLLEEHGGCEVIVVTRGGGSKEDLMAFMDEGLARRIAACKVPVVSAVGHAIDTTLSDLVADVVVPTPTAAAVEVLPDGHALAAQADHVAGRLDRAVLRLLQRRRERLAGLQGRLRHPSAQLARTRLELERLQGRMERAASGLIQRRKNQLRASEGRLNALSPLQVLGRGYALVRDPTGTVIHDADQVAVGDPLTVRVGKGSFHVQVRLE